MLYITLLTTYRVQCNLRIDCFYKKIAKKKDLISLDKKRWFSRKDKRRHCVATRLTQGIINMHSVG